MSTGGHPPPLCSGGVPHAPSVRGSARARPPSVAARPLGRGRSPRPAQQAEDAVEDAVRRRRRRQAATPKASPSRQHCPWTPLPQGGAGTPPNLVWQGAVPDGRRASHICLHWLVYVLIVLKLVQVWTALPKALFKAVEVVPVLPPLSPPSPPTPLAPGSPYDALPGVSRFRGTPTAPETPRPPLSVGCRVQGADEAAHERLPPPTRNPVWP